MSAISTAPALKSLWRARQKVFAEIVEALARLATSLPLRCQNPEQQAVEHKQAQNTILHPMRASIPINPDRVQAGKLPRSPHRPIGHPGIL